MFFEEIIGAFTGQNRRTRHRQVAVGTVSGLLVGAAAALLLAPQSGEKTRKDIARTAKQGAEAVKDYSGKAARKIRETAGDLRDGVVDTYHNIVDRGEDVVDEAARDARDAARSARRKARSVGEDVAEDVEKTADKVSDKAAEKKEELKKADKKD